MTTRGTRFDILDRGNVDALPYVLAERSPESAADRWVLQEVPQRIRQRIFTAQNVLEDIPVFPSRWCHRCKYLSRPVPR